MSDIGSVYDTIELTPEQQTKLRDEHRAFQRLLQGPEHDALHIENRVQPTLLDAYQNCAMDFHVPDPVRLAAYGLGIAGESGECADIIKKHIGHGHPLNVEKLKLELGDVLWYVAALAHLIDMPLSEIAQANLDKLRKRYPNGFSTEASIARVDVNTGDAK